MSIWSRLRPLTAGAAMVALMTTGCASTIADDGKLNVLVAFYPYEFVATQLIGDAGTVTNLTQPGQEPHDLELGPAGIAELATADLVIYQKGFQPAVDEAIAQAEPAHVIDALSLASPLASSEEGHDHAEDGADHADDHDHADGGSDPHLWLDPTNLRTVSTAVAQQLATLRPADAEAIEQRATALATELDDLDNRFSTGLDACERKEFVTSHAAFGYLAHRYGLHQIGISGFSPEAEPSAARIAEVHDLVEQYGITTIFYETLVSPKVAQSIATDLGLATAVLDPLEGLTEESAGTDYISVMDANLTALRTANGCT